MSEANSSRVTIEPLQRHRRHIPALAAWHHGQWSAINPGDSITARVARLMKHAEGDSLPSTWVAVDGERLLGSASLVTTDLETHPQLHPWLASVFVVPECRGRGVGSLLVQHVAAEARDAGFEQLYLFTPDRQKFYERLGWRLLEIVPHFDMPVALMEIQL